MEVEENYEPVLMEYKMKIDLLTTKLIGRYKVGSLVFSYRSTIQARWLCIVLHTRKILLQKCSSHTARSTILCDQMYQFYQSKCQNRTSVPEVLDACHTDHRQWPWASAGAGKMGIFARGNWD